MLGPVDSKERLLSQPEIILSYVYELTHGREGASYVESVVSAIAECSYKKSERVQFGNTLFLGLRAKTKSGPLMIGRAFNKDTARNFVVNGLKYFDYLQQRKYKTYISTFNNRSYLNVFRLYHKRLSGTDTKLGVFKYGDTGNYIVIVDIGSQKLRTWGS